MMLLIYKSFFQENSNLEVSEVPEVPLVPANGNRFKKIENLETLEVPEVPDVISIYKSVYNSIFRTKLKFRGSRGFIGSGL